jgi:hypothetical protein
VAGSPAGVRLRSDFALLQSQTVQRRNDREEVRVRLLASLEALKSAESDLYNIRYKDFRSRSIDEYFKVAQEFVLIYQAFRSKPTK